MSARADNAAADPVRRAPRHVRFFSAILQVLMAAGIPLGYNRLVTIPGRKSGVPRITPLAVINIKGRRWVWAPWGEVNWVRNLRAAGRASIKERGGNVEVVATELTSSERVGFFRDSLGPLARSIPFGVWLVRIVDGVDLADPVAAAEGRVVFELQPQPED